MIRTEITGAEVKDFVNLFSLLEKQDLKHSCWPKFFILQVMTLCGK